MYSYVNNGEYPNKHEIYAISIQPFLHHAEILNKLSIRTVSLISEQNLKFEFEQEKIEIDSASKEMIIRPFLTQLKN